MVSRAGHCLGEQDAAGVNFPAPLLTEAKFFLDFSLTFE
jgi:hypothetical protein